MSKRILVVEDDALTRRSLVFNLEQAGYVAASAATGEEAVKLAQISPPDLILLDISLPGMDGLETLRTFRQQDIDVPVIFLTARRRELDEIVGLELGADDYITKPFDMDVVLAHMKAVLRRATSAGAPPADKKEPLVVGDLCIDPAAHVVHVGDQEVELAPKEFDLLLVLAQNAKRVLSIDELLSLVWGAEWVGENQTLYVHIRWLREKIEENPSQPRRLLTVRGAGYKLTPPD